MPTYLQNQPAGAKTVQANFQLKEEGVRFRKSSVNHCSVCSGSIRVAERVSRKCNRRIRCPVFRTEENQPTNVVFPVIFDHEILAIHDALPLIDVLNLSSEIYVPRGATALNDGIGTMIQQIGKRAKRSRPSVSVAISLSHCRNRCGRDRRFKPYTKISEHFNRSGHPAAVDPFLGKNFRRPDRSALPSKKSGRTAPAPLVSIMLIFNHLPCGGRPFDYPAKQWEAES
jgi:hypothetical protein